MFHALLIASSPDRCTILQRIAQATRKMLLLRQLDYYPEGRALASLASGLDADLVLLDLQSEEAAAECLVEIRSRRSMVAMIGIGGSSDGIIPVADDALSARVSFPPEPDALLRAVDEALHRVRGHFEPNLLAFLPAKAGSGASTVALHTAAALAGPLKKKVLIIEADLRSGILGILLNQEVTHSVGEALQAASEMDTFRLDQFLVKAQGMDLLLTAPGASTPWPQWHDYFLLLDFVKSRYDFVIVDLPELVNPATREIVQRARLVFNVCTSEVPSLRLAAKRVEELKNWHVPDERIQILLNRYQQKEISPKDLEQFLRRPVFKAIPNDYPALREAMLEGRCVSANTPLGKAFVELAGELAGEPIPDEPRPSRLGSLLRFKTT